MEAVLDDIDRRGFKRVNCLGDIVGYGPNPVECWRIVRRRAGVLLMGNHDFALVTRDMPRFHPRARVAIGWTRARILEEKDGQDILGDIATLPTNVAEGMSCTCTDRPPA